MEKEKVDYCFAIVCIALVFLFFMILICPRFKFTNDTSTEIISEDVTIIDKYDKTHWSGVWTGSCFVPIQHKRYYFVILFSDDTEDTISVSFDVYSSYAVGDFYTYSYERLV